DSFIRANNAIDGMAFRQLRTGILLRRLSGRLTTSYVLLIDCTVQHPFRHSFPRRLSWAALIPHDLFPLMRGKPYVGSIRDPGTAKVDSHNENPAPSA